MLAVASSNADVASVAKQDVFGLVIDVFRGTGFA